VSEILKAGLYILVLVLLLMVPATLGLEDGRIGVLYVGCMARSRPFWDMKADMLFSLNYVQATTRDWGAWGPIQQVDESVESTARMVRLYMPRTLKDLTEKFDIVAMANANRFAVGPKYTEMLAEGVRENNVSLFMGGGWESFGGSFGRPDWGETSLGALIPTENVVDSWIQYPSGAFRVVIEDQDHEFITSIPWDDKEPFSSNFHHNLVKPKPGSEILATVESTSFSGHPAFITWDLSEQTRVFAWTGEIHVMSWGDAWEYALDVGANLMIYLDGRPVPQDVELVHSLRMKMIQVTTRKSLLLSLLEFCDSFGANTQKVVDEVDEVDRVIWDSRPIYFDLRFAEMLEIYNEVDEILKAAEGNAVALKQRALLWVYVIEWLAVTGTSLIAGFILWTVMIRRRLYREVRTTKLSEYAFEER
jgi:uncharacterized membrane protein